ncbi:phosphotransferase [Enterococcus sp. AZ192]|uniref:phosphotransferase n=1 Tax=unclassified Enterococcus TaxID=2608891 RepID=UPI003D26B842
MNNELIKEYLSATYDSMPEKIERIQSKFGTNNLYFLKNGKQRRVLKFYRSKHSFVTDTSCLKLIYGDSFILNRFIDNETSTTNIYSVIMEYVSGEIVQFSEEQPSDKEFKLARKIGEALCCFHKNSRQLVNQQTNIFSPVNWKVYVNDRVKQFESKMKDQQLVLAINYLKEKNIFNQTQQEITSQILHNDLLPDNIIYNHEKDQVYLIDFERAIVGHYEYDFAKLFWRTFHFDTSTINHFLYGYGIGRIDETFKKNQIFYLVFHILEMISYLKNQKETIENKKTYESGYSILTFLIQADFNIYPSSDYLLDDGRHSMFHK